MHNVGYFFLAYTLVVAGIAALFGYLLVRVRKLQAEVDRLSEKDRGPV